MMFYEGFSNHFMWYGIGYAGKRKVMILMEIEMFDVNVKIKQFIIMRTNKND